MLALTGKEKSNRLPVLVSRKDRPRPGESPQLFGVPTIPVGTRGGQTNTIVGPLNHQCVQQRVVALNDDTSASNNGRHNGASA